MRYNCPTAKRILKHRPLDNAMRSNAAARKRVIRRLDKAVRIARATVMDVMVARYKIEHFVETGEMV